MVSGTTLKANHIVGGEISYEFVGFRGGRVGSDTLRYRVILLLVRDCNGGAAFDRTVPVAIYQGNNTRPIRNLRISRPVFSRVSPDQSNPCLIVPPGFCEEEALYSDTIELVRSNLPYILTYQICCRNANIANIVDSKNTGTTFTVEISPAAQNLYSSSPRFTAAIKSELCIGVESSLPLQVSDKDGDRLVYSLCAPLVGGGPLGGGVNDANLASTPQGIKPDPAAPGPYAEVPYLPNFSSSRPLGNTGTLSLDSLTGVLRVFPRTLGQFSMGICIKEYRNGVLIGMIRRDIQIKVSNCNFAIDARVQADSTNNQGSFWLRSCNRPNFTFTNTSLGEDKIFAYRWAFNINGRTETRDTKNASFDFGNPGTYTGSLVLNPGTVCTDTARIVVQVFPSVRAQFTATTPACELGAVAFNNQSTLNPGASFRSIEWNFGDNNRSTQVSPQHEYTRAGNYPVSLVILTNTGCRDTARQNVNYFPVPATGIRLQALPSELCAQTGQVLLSLNVPPAMNHPGYLVEWDLGDGSTATGFSTRKSYPNPGTYTLSYRISAPSNCSVQGNNASQPLLVVEKPSADFSFSPEEPSAREPLVNFTENATLATTWRWDFGGKGNSTERNPSFNFPTEGQYEVKLVVGNSNFCRDSISKTLKVKSVETMYIPSAFSPNGKEPNTVFKPLGLLPGIEQYQFRVYSRWGQLVFQSSDPELGWNGRVNNTGTLCVQDSYFYQVVFRSAVGKTTNKQGSVMLLW
jgi:gliding motility-associated-like protein